MEIKITKSELLSGLFWTQSVVERKVTMPVLSNALLEATPKTLTITATDLEVGVRSTHTADVATPGKVTVHAKNLYEIIRQLPDEKVKLTVKANHWVEIVSGKSRFKIVGMSADEFPKLSFSEGKEVQSVPTDTVLEMISKTAYAMSTDEVRYNLNGIYCEARDVEGKPGIRFVATDGHRMAYCERPTPGKFALPKGVIIPRKGVGELKRLCDSGGDAPVSLYFDGKQLVAARGAVTMLVRLIDGQFPPYEQVIPKDLPKVVTADRKQFIDSLKRASLVASDMSHAVKMTFSPGMIEISTTNPDVGEVHEEMAATYKGETFDVGFNAKYFLDLLAVISDESVVMGLKNNVSPCVIRSEFDRGFLSMVMPRRL
ncbi:MAG: DNA polymerase III subunit beta [Deltaproteobacteria bacterium CG11_big_fil_rev_8_21_14_0_20_47_16]|nr:MAG: DNA polymerase III subunit beta [Deltaproteobacteria bacterium CG11_big_fil_rev_8_21_14_0_20_47_16]